MPDSAELLNNFMIDKNKEALGEKIEKVIEKNDNFDTEAPKAMNKFTGESISNSDNGMLAARKLINTCLTIPIIIGGIFSAFYIVLKIGPAILSFIKSILFHIWL